MLGLRQITVALVVWAAITCRASAQRFTSFGPITPQTAIAQVDEFHPVQLPCRPKNEPFDMDDYDGPFNRLVARFSQKVDRVTVHPAARRHSGLRPCSLSAGEKLRLWVVDSIDPINFLAAGFSAGLDQAQNSDPPYGQGAAGYGKRYGAELADHASGGFFGIFLYPTIFHQDPRYYRLGQGSTGHRLVHALEHRFVSYNDAGKRTVNYSEWFSAVSTNLVGNLYHPGNARGFEPLATRVCISVGNDMGWDVLREFWPEIAHKFHLPFRTHEDEATNTNSPQGSSSGAVN